MVVPAHDEEDRIGACLDALLDQADPVDEIIVVDNASTDRTAVIAAAYPGVVVLHEPRPGVTYARNRGFDAATGDVLARIDADTVVCRDWAAAVRSSFSGRARHGVAGPAGLAGVSSPERPLGVGFYRVFRQFHELTVGNGPLMYGHNMAISRDAWPDLRAIVTTGDENISEDIDVALALLHIGGTVEFVPDMRVTIDLIRTLRPRKLAQYYRSDRLTTAKYRRLHGRTKVAAIR